MSTKNDTNKKAADANSTNKPPPDGGYAWVILFAAFFVSFVADGILYCTGLLINDIKQDLNLPDALVNSLTSLNTGLLFFSGTLVSGLANLFSCRVVVVGGAAVTAFMYVFTAISPSIYFMMITYGVIGGISTGCTYIASLIIIPEYFDKKKGLANGITMSGSGVGSFVMSPIIEIIIERYGWEVCFVICGGLILQLCIFGCLLKPLNSQSVIQNEKKKPNIELKSFEDKSNITSETSTEKALSTTKGGDQDQETKCYQQNACLNITLNIFKEMIDLRLLFQEKAFLLISVSNFFLFFGYFAPFLYIEEITEQNNLNKEDAAFLISIFGIVNIPARLIFGFIGDRNFVSSLTLNLLSISTSSVALFCYQFLQKDFPRQIVFMVFYAIGAAGFNSLTTLYLCEIVGNKNFGRAFGIINLFRGSGCLIGPILAGFIAKSISSIFVFSFSGICFAIAAALTILTGWVNSNKKTNNSENSQTANA